MFILVTGPELCLIMCAIQPRGLFYRRKPVETQRESGCGSGWGREDAGLRGQSSDREEVPVSPGEGLEQGRRVTGCSVCSAAPSDMAKTAHFMLCVFY